MSTPPAVFGWSFALLGFAGMVFAPQYAHADPVALTAQADSYVYVGANASNYGRSGYIGVKASSGYDRKAWVRFDTSPLTDAAGAATFTLTINTTATGTDPNNNTWHFNVYGLNDGDPGESWVEGTGTNSSPVTGVTGATPPNPIVNANAPGNAASGVDPALTTLLGAFTITGKGTDGDAVSISGGAGSALVDFLNADTDHQVTFIIVRTDADADFAGTPNVLHAFYSRESADATHPAPTLTVTTVPEPASLGLIAPAGALLLRRRNANRR